MMWTESSQETLFRGKNHKTTGFFGFGFFGLFAPLNKFLAREWQNPPRWPKLNQYMCIRSFLQLNLMHIFEKFQLKAWSYDPVTPGILPNLWSVMVGWEGPNIVPIHFTPKAPFWSMPAVAFHTWQKRTWVKSWGPRFYKKNWHPSFGPRPNKPTTSSEKKKT